MSTSYNLIEPDKIPKEIFESLLPNMSSEQACLLLLPKEFNDIASMTMSMGSINLEIYNAETGNDIIIIPASLYNPEMNNAIFPKFVLNFSQHVSKAVNYFKNSPQFVLNQNQLLFIMLHHRLTQLRPQNIRYSNLIKTDIEALKKYGEYNTAVTHNAKLKSKNSIVFVDPFKKTGTRNLEWRTDYMQKQICIGEFINGDKRRVQLGKATLTAIARDFNIQPASRSEGRRVGKECQY